MSGVNIFGYNSNEDGDIKQNQSFKNIEVVADDQFNNDMTNACQKTYLGDSQNQVDQAVAGRPMNNNLSQNEVELSNNGGDNHQEASIQIQQNKAEAVEFKDFSNKSNRNQRSSDINKQQQPQENNSFSDLSMAAANPNNKGLTAVGQGLHPDNLMGSFGSIPTQHLANELNQTHGRQSKQAADQVQARQSSNLNVDKQMEEHERTAEKPKNRHQAKPRNKSGHKGQNKTKSIGHYRIGKTIGEGTFGKVKLGVHNITGEKVAVKILEKHKIIEDVDVERVSREIKILKLARHPNIIQLYEIIETPKQLYLITEYVSKGELFDYIVKKQRLEESEACKFFQQIISGIQYLKELGIVHRDMKPENLLLDQNGQIKIVDFGLSNTYEPGQTLKTACGSPCYAAPEMIAGKEYHGAQVDVWSCGVILFAMVCGYLPFEDPDTNKLYKKILDGKFEIPAWVSESCQDLMNKILENNPEKRLDSDEIMNHEWYTTLNQPVIHNIGLIIGKNKIPLEPQLVKMLKKYGFEQADAEKSLNQNKHNQVTTIYYLLHKRYVIDGKLPTNFNANQPKNKKLTQTAVDDQQTMANKQANPDGDDGYSPVKKIDVKNDVSQKSLAKSPRSPILAMNFTKNQSKEINKIDSQKEIQLSVSPVKKGRRFIEHNGETLGEANGHFNIKASALKFEDDIGSPVGPLPDNFKSFNIDKEEKDRRTEQKGSVSPEKKKRRAFANVMSSDEEANNNEDDRFQVGQGLKLNLNKVDGESNRNLSRLNSKQIENTHPANLSNSQPRVLNEATGSSVSYAGDGEKIVLLQNDRKQDSKNRSNAMYTSSVAASNIYSPADQNIQNVKQIKLEFGNMKLDGQTQDRINPQNIQMISNGVREYQQKIKAYTKENYKYRQREEGRSVDEKIKTKALLKNIEKILNQGILGKEPQKSEDRMDTIGGSQPQPSRQMAPQVPKTTTAAAYESQNKQQVINMKRQNKRASSIDECVVQLQIQNKQDQTASCSCPDQNHAQNCPKYQFLGGNLANLNQSQQANSRALPAQLNNNMYNSFNQEQPYNLNKGAGLRPSVFYLNDGRNSLEPESNNQLIIGPDQISVNQSNVIQQKQLQLLNYNDSQNSSRVSRRPPIYTNQFQQSDKKIDRLQKQHQNHYGQDVQRQNFMYPQKPTYIQKHVFSESPNRDRVYNQVGPRFMDPMLTSTNNQLMNQQSNHFMNYPLMQSNGLLSNEQIAHLNGGSIMGTQSYFENSNLISQPFDSRITQKNHFERTGASSLEAMVTNTTNANNQQTHFRTAPQRPRNTFKRQFDASNKQHPQPVNTSQGYRTRQQVNRVQLEQFNQNQQANNFDDSKFEQEQPNGANKSITPNKGRANNRRPSGQRQIGSGPNESRQHANTTKPFVQRRVLQSEQQQPQQQLSQDQQQQLYQNMRQDPINFTNQYNIYCHLNDFQKYPWRYNPLVSPNQAYSGSSSMTSTQQNLNDPNLSQSMASPIGPQPFMQTSHMGRPMHNQYLNYLNQPDNLLEFEQQINLLRLQSQISMIQQQQLSQQLTALGIMPGLAMQPHPMAHQQIQNFVPMTPGLNQLGNHQIQSQQYMHAMAAQGQPSQQMIPQFMQQDQVYQQIQSKGDNSSPQKKISQHFDQNNPQSNSIQLQPPNRGTSPYESSTNQSNLGNVNQSLEQAANSGKEASSNSQINNQSSGGTFTRNNASNKINTDSLKPSEHEIQ